MAQASGVYHSAHTELFTQIAEAKESEKELIIYS